MKSTTNEHSEHAVGGYTNSSFAQLPFAQIIQAKLQEVPNEDPVKYMEYMYKTVHPGAVNVAINEGKRALIRENKKNGKPVNVYVTLGGDSMTQSLYTGAVSALLWLQDYIDASKASFGCSQAEVNTCKKVLRAIGLPHSSDAITDTKTGEITASSTCRHYASFLGSFVQWCTTGVTSVKVQGNMRSNLELSRYLTATALNNFPSIPYTAYYIGSIKTDDMMELTEKLSRTVDFNRFMTPEALELNQPKFVVQTDNAPLVGIAGHPLANVIYGQESNGSVEWFGLFQESEEFSKLCIRAGVSVKDVKKYIYMTSWNDHQRKITEGNKMALFVQSQAFVKEVFELRHSTYGINDDQDDDAYAVV